MSDVLFKKLAMPAAFGLALALTLTGNTGPASAGLKQKALSKGAAAAARAQERSQEQGADESSAVADEENSAAGNAAASDEASETADEGTSPAAQDDVGQKLAEPAKPVGGAQTPAANQAATDPASKPLPEARPDYYTERAKKAVEQDGKSDGAPHPLQLAHPDQNVVVCEGGCSSNQSSQIVFMEPRSARKPIAEGSMVPSSSEAGANAGSGSVVTCEAGCYGKMPRSYAGIPGGAAIADTAMIGADGGSWVTTVTPSAEGKPQAKNGSGNWMARISKETGQSASGVGKPVAAPSTELKSTSPAPAPATSPADSALSLDTVAVDKPATAAVSAPEPQVAMLEQAKAAQPTAPVKSIADTPAPDAAAQAAASPLSPSEATAPKPGEVNSGPAGQGVAASAPAPAAATPSPAVAAIEGAVAVTPSAGIEAASAKPAPAEQALAEQAESVKPNVDASKPDAAAPRPTAPVVASEAKPPAIEQAAVPASDATSEVFAEKPAPEQVAELTKPEPVAPETKPAPVEGTRRDPVVNIETADGEMAAAMAKARASLPEFWAKLDQPGADESDFSLKVAIEGGNASEVEHFWLVNISRKDGKIMGTISNDPSTVKTVRRGQIYEVNPDKISDWMFKRGGKMVGNETMRPLLKRLPAQQAEGYRQMYETP
ncbi:MAG: DUF2314 domain-containing protein [Hyphomicrobium sp.]